MVKLNDAFEELKLNDEEQKLLTICLDVANNPFGYVSGRGNPDPDVSLPYKATKLGGTKSIEKYFYTELNQSVDKNVPIEAEMQKYYFEDEYYAAGNANKRLLVNKAFSSFGTDSSFQTEIAQEENNLKKISWLHLTDLHWGMRQQKSLWSSVREEFYRDLKRVFEKTGAWDLVLFTGDLTQYGKTEEFDGLDRM